VPVDAFRWSPESGDRVPQGPGEESAEEFRVVLDMSERGTRGLREFVNRTKRPVRDLRLGV
jgi:hypothetical protein